MRSTAAMAAGATDNGKPGACLYYDPVITLRTFSIPTVTVSKRSTRAGNTANHRASKFQRAPTCADARIVTRSPMAGKLIIYGATGYAGQLVSEQATRAGLDFIRRWPARTSDF